MARSKFAKKAKRQGTHRPLPFIFFANHGLSADADFQLFTLSNLTTFKNLSNFALDYQHFA